MVLTETTNIAIICGVSAFGIIYAIY